MPTNAGDLRAFLDAFLSAHLFEGDQNGPFGFYRDEANVGRLGLALEPWPGLAAWAEAERLDALFLHRPWGLEATSLPVLAYHYAFDERLTTGYNPLLAKALGMSGLEVLGDKEGRPLGMIGGVTPRPLATFRALTESTFGALEGVYGVQTGRVGDVSCACVVGAMRPTLLYEAAERGAQVYLTGQYRKGAARAVAQTGLAVFEIGHARSERWGLRRLAEVLRGRFADLETSLQ